MLRRHSRRQIGALLAVLAVFGMVLTVPQIAGDESDAQFEQLVTSADGNLLRWRGPVVQNAVVAMAREPISAEVLSPDSAGCVRVRVNGVDHLPVWPVGTELDLGRGGVEFDNGELIRFSRLWEIDGSVAYVRPSRMEDVDGAQWPAVEMDNAALRIMSRCDSSGQLLMFPQSAQVVF